MQTQTSALQQQSTVYYNQHNLNCHNFIIRVKETMVWLKTRLFGMKEISDIIQLLHLLNNWNGTKLCSCSLILAMQTKLKGNAKAWNDSLQSVFNRRCEFSAQLLANFAKYRNELNIHTEIMASQRLQGEKS